MIKKMFPYFIAAGFLLAPQHAGAFDVGNWFTGRVAALDKAGILEKTVIVFTGDNGTFINKTGIRRRTI